MLLGQGERRRQEHELLVIKLSVTTAGHATAGPIALWSPSRGQPPGDARPPGSRGSQRARPPQQALGARAEQAAPDLARRARSAAAGGAPSQPDSQAEQPRVSPSCQNLSFQTFQFTLVTLADIWCRGGFVHIIQLCGVQIHCSVIWRPCLRWQRLVFSACLSLFFS